MRAAVAMPITVAACFCSNKTGEPEPPSAISQACAREPRPNPGRSVFAVQPLEIANSSPIGAVTGKHYLCFTFRTWQIGILDRLDRNRFEIHIVPKR